MIDQLIPSLPFVDYVIMFLIVYFGALLANASVQHIDYDLHKKLDTMDVKKKEKDPWV